MKTLASALLGCVVLAGMTGCIPIGVRGSTFAAAHPPATERQPACDASSPADFHRAGCGVSDQDRTASAPSRG
jgi:hypothetical protein